MIYMPKTFFHMNKDSRELSTPYQKSFPCGLELHDSSKSMLGNVIPWHWHPYFEVNIIISGEMIFRIDQKEYLLKKGQVLFINANRLHTLSLPPGSSAETHYALKFEKEILCGKGDNPLDVKYMKSIYNDNEFSSYPIYPDSEEGVRLVSYLHRLIYYFKKEPFGYEYEIIGLLGRFWCEMIQRAKKELRLSDSLYVSDNDNLRPMLKYISDNYSNKITLSDIASAASLSTRECDRCFLKYTHMTPMEYLIFYRTHTAAELLAYSDKNILEISQDCGFNSSSYFGKLFNREFGCSPSEFRKEKKY